MRVPAIILGGLILAILGATLVTTSVATPPDKGDIEEDWLAAQRANSIATYEEFILKYPSAKYSDDARDKLLKLIHTIRIVVSVELGGYDSVCENGGRIPSWGKDGRESDHIMQEARKYIASLDNTIKIVSDDTISSDAIVTIKASYHVLASLQGSTAFVSILGETYRERFHSIHLA